MLAVHILDELVEISLEYWQRATRKIYPEIVCGNEVLFDAVKVYLRISRLYIVLKEEINLWDIWRRGMDIHENQCKIVHF